MDFLKPSLIHRLHRLLSLPLLLTGALLLIAGVYQALFVSPPDYQQGESVRIMYVHVPSAWLGMALYGFLALCGVSYLIWKNPLAYFLGRSAAPVGALFTALCLVTGCLWGKPIWGAWWVWDARLTSMLILFFLYLGYILLGGHFDNPERAAGSCSILSLLGALNLPVIKFSVDWWNTLHQPASLIRSGGISIDGSMLLPLLLMFAGFLSLSGWLILLNTQTLLLKRKWLRKQMAVLV